MIQDTAPRLSIVIPTLNRARLLVRALDSALAQTAPGIEIIVSDNGSSDDTPAVLSRYSDPRLRLLRHASTMPADEHGNFLIAQCRGTYFLGLSDDDYLEPDFADKALQLLEAHPGVAFAYTACEVHFGEVCIRSLGGPPLESGLDFLAAFFAGRREVCWCACVSRLADLRAIGPIPNGRIFGDMYYWTRLALRGDVGCVDSPLAHYIFMSADNLSTGVGVRPWADETRLLADEVLAGIERLAPQRAAAVRSDMRRFVARSTANQFVWRLLRGAARGSLWAELPGATHHLAGDPSVWPRVLAALLLPRAWTQWLVLRTGRQRARARGSAP
jgi:glycosyltransferase involved in cell wall biosynthesis